MGNNDYIYGKNSCRATLLNNSEVKSAIVSTSFNDKEILSLISKRKIVLKRVSPNQLDSMFKGASTQGIALQIAPYKYMELDTLLKRCENNKHATVVLLDGLEDPQNLGAILRSCDAFGVEGVIIPSTRSVTVTPTVVKVSTGAIEYVPVCMVTNLNQTIDILKKNGFWVVASDGLAKDDYDKIDYDMKVALVVGSEGKGISSLVLKNADFITKIPMVGHVNSLNASVATGIYLAMIQSKRK